MLAPAKEVEHVATRGVDTAHHLGDDRDRRVVGDLAKVGRKHATRVVQRWWVITLLSDVAHEGLDHPQAVTGGAFDVVRRFGE